MYRRMIELEFDTSSPIDIDKGVFHADGNMKLYFKILRRFKAKSLPLELEKMSHAVNQRSFKEIQQSAENLIEHTAIIGVGKIYYVCLKIHKAFGMNDFNEMFNQYPFLIESCIEFKLACRLIKACDRADNNCKSKHEQSS